MNFSEHLRQLAAPIWEAQLHHPFVVALGKGTLPLQKFRYYILQDARYLEELARVFAAGAEIDKFGAELSLTKLLLSDPVLPTESV